MNKYSDYTDEELFKLWKEINKDTKDYLDYINNLNECAFTDRKIENIIKKAKELDKYYNDNFEKATNNDEIGIYYNPMGNLYYERIGDEDNE